jgi:hypothetical protein
MRKTAFLLCALCLVAVPEDLAAKERHGADTTITMINGRVVKGELIAVKMDSKVLLISSWGIDESIGISEIRSIRIVKNSKALNGTILGSLLGGGMGLIVGFIVMEEYPGARENEVLPPLVLVGALAGGVVGLLIGSPKKEGEIFSFEGRPPEGIRMILEKLRSKAKVPDFR